MVGFDENNPDYPDERFEWYQRKIKRVKNPVKPIVSPPTLKQAKMLLCHLLYEKDVDKLTDSEAIIYCELTKDAEIKDIIQKEKKELSG